MGNRRRFYKGKTVAAALCLGLCLWCGYSALRGWWAEDVPVFSPNLGGEAALAETERLAIRQTGGEALLPFHSELLLDSDGVVPYREDGLPGTTATPEPGRDYGPVQEIVLEGGEAVDCFFVRDSTDSGTDLWQELTQEPAVSLKKDGSVEILLYHTHTSEAYAKSYAGFYYTDAETRSQNRDISVVTVGEEIKAALEARGYGVVHDVTVNDTLYNGSYARSWEVIQKNLEEYPGIQVTVDIHRDSMTTEEGVKYKPTVTVNGRKAAQIMLLAGCDADGGWGDFPNWRENLRLILRVQQKAEQLYPGLARPLNFSNNKYNMNATPGSMLVEVGTEVNTVAEAKYAGKLLGDILAATLDETGA